MPISRDGFAKPETNTWKPGKPGDEIKGIFTGFVKEFDGAYGKTNIYELVGIEGSYHALDDEGKPVGSPIKIEKDESYSVFERNTFKDDIAHAKPGQEVIITYVESRKPKSGGKPYKYVECLLGGMNDEWVAAHVTPEAVEDRPF